MRIAIAAALIATSASAQGTTSPTPARETRYGVTTGSPLSGTARGGATSGSPLSTARLPAPGARAQRAASASTVRPARDAGAMSDRSAPMNITQPPR